MKNYFKQIILSIFLGSLMAYLLIGSYNDASKIALKNDTSKLYYLEKGKYKSLDEMKKDMASFSNYIYDEVNLTSYIGVSSNKNNALKLVNFYKKKNVNVKIRRKITDNYKFALVVRDYDRLLSKTDDENVIETINNQVLARYEEMLHEN